MTTMSPSSDEPAAKKPQTSFNTEEKDIKRLFGPDVFDEQTRTNLRKSIANSEPYKWGVFKNLIDDTLLRQVRREVEREIHFTQKETDIYKVFQSGDLANLSGLDWDDLSRLPSVFKLREALYSQEFRDLVSEVTQAGKLSGVKTDMSINTYTKGCHLLTHDDVIGSRRVSFILYMPDPDREWKEHYGGALRLFPAVVPNVPQTDPSHKFVPQFNQMAFFTVQPGLSFHDVEEVRVDKHRLSIQGWYHIPQEGEDGYVPGEQEATEAKSTLQQLESKELQEYDFPKEVRVPFSSYEIKGLESVERLTENDVEYLNQYLNEDLLEESQIKKLQQKFVEENLVHIDDVLNDKYANVLKKLIRTTELDEVMPKTANEVEGPWKVAVPPHKWRYLYLDGTSPQDLTSLSGYRLANNTNETPNFALASHTTEHNTTKELLALGTFIRSTPFKKWMTLITDLVLTSDQILIRRFRPGHDFKLATTVDTTGSSQDAVLEATLCLTPSKGWESGEVGGYELCMATDNNDGDADNEEEDPAVYKQTGEDTVLVNEQASWNRMTIMVRDPSVLKFIKYVSFNAMGSRWDISAQWDVDTKGDDDDDDEEADDQYAYD